MIRNGTLPPIVAIAALLCACAAAAPPASPRPQTSVDERLIGLDTLVDGARVYLPTEVDKPAVALPGPPHPRYPMDLKTSGIEGQVEFLFIVDTAGVVEVGTIRALSSSHRGFTTSGLLILPMRRFVPAMRAGQRVRVWTLMAFEFRLGAL